MASDRRRQQASKVERFKASRDPSALFVQKVSVSRCEATGLLSFSARSAAAARASQAHTGVTECLLCDGYHVEGVYA